MTIVDGSDEDTVVQYRTCPLCEATCGLEVTTRGDQVVRIRGDRDNPFSHGYLCPKGSTLKQLHEDPDRLRAPLIRRGDDPATATWDEVSWEEAFAEVERGLTGVLDAHGRDAVALYFGNPSAHTLAGVLYNRTIAKALGSRNVYSASTVDQMPKHVSSGLMFGNPLLIPVPDLDRTDHLLMLGANPWESNGSLCTAPDFPGRVKAIQARGGKVVVVDPRRTRTAQEADEHVAIRPGTDAHLLVAMANVVVADGLVDLGRLGEPTGDHVAGLDAACAALAPFTPEAVADLCGIDAEVIRRMAHELAAAPSAAVYGRIGTHTVEFGTLASWAVDLLNALTGNLDRPGGAMFPLAAHERVGRAGPGRGFALGRHRSRVHGFPEVKGEFPVAALAGEIETPGQDQVRALITVAGNPVMSTPNSGRLDAALGKLEFMVSVDIYLNETTRRANVVLPAPSALQRSEYALAFHSLAVENFADWSPPLFEPTGPMEHEILAKLSLIAAGQGAAADTAAIDEMMIAGVLQGAIAAADSPIAGRTLEELTPMLGGHQRDRPGGRRHDPHRPLRRLVRRRAGRAVAGQARGQPARGAPRPPPAAATRRPAHAERPRRAGTRTDPRGSRPARGVAGASRQRRPRARRATAPALQQLVDAQRERAGEGQGAVHAADPPRRCRQPRAQRWRPRRSGVAGGQGRRSGRGHRQHPPGGRQPAPRVGS